MARIRVVVGVLAIVCMSSPANAAPKPEAPPTRVRFTAPAGESLLVHGEYPPTQSSCVDPYQPLLHARYRGTVEVIRAADGTLSLIGELGFEDYLKGIAEVPRDWPMEALKAQVVAARTYALNRMAGGSGSGEYDLCATTSCQVYVGMKVEAGPHGERWVQAVDETAGEALLFHGQPASTYYSSTSPGRTFDVEDVFGGEALPYLRGAPEHDDGASPLAHWRVDVPMDDLARFLAEEGLWTGGPIRSVEATKGSIRISGRTDATVSKDSLRDALNATASCRKPKEYPRYEPDGYRLPQTVPSRWFRASQDGQVLVLVGRGWGHGIGMVQWGAYGKAERGLGYADILAAYYGGLRPSPTSIPGTIRILIAEGMTRLTVVPSGDTTVEPDPGRKGPWLIAGGRGVRLQRGSRPGPVLEATGFTASPRLAPGHPYLASLTVSDDADVALEFLQRGQPVSTTDPVVLEEESTRLEISSPELADGRYEVRAIVSDGVDVVTTAALPVRVRAGGPAMSSPSSEAPPTPGEITATARNDESGFPLVLIAGVAGLLLVIGLALALTGGRGRGLHRP